MNKKEPNKARARAELIAPVASAVNLTTIFMTKMKAELHLPSEKVTSATEDMGSTKRISCRLDQERKSLEVIVLFEVVGFRDGDHKARTFEVSAEFRLDYAVRGDLSSFSDGQVKAFGEFNAVFNAWPYWREFVQSTTVRLALPALVLPLHKINLQAAVSVSEEQEVEQNA